MANYTTINKHTAHFNTTLFNGTGAAGNAVTGTGFNADLTWIKRRNSTSSHMVYDKVRGVQKNIRVDSTAAESAGDANNLNAWSSDGFTVGSSGYDNGSGGTFTSWNWLANGAGSANTDGTIGSHTVSANTTAGFSIVKWVGTGDARTIGHGLGAVPKMIIAKNLSDAENFAVFHTGLSDPSEEYMKLNETSAATDGAATTWNSTLPTSSVFSCGVDNRINANNDNYIAYCFADKVGYSKFSNFYGNGNADGTFVYTGFKPAFVMIKNAANASEEWGIWDSKRDTDNVVQNRLVANVQAAENSSDYLDFLSNGFKLRTSASGLNQAGTRLIYMAFGQSLVGSNNIACTAR